MVVKIAEQSDPEAIQKWGPVPKGNLLPHHSRRIGLEPKAIDSQGCGTPGRG